MIGNIWAKDSGETLSEHTIKCLRAAQSLLDSLPELQPELEQIRESLRKNVLLAVAMHDVGKAATGFQRVLRKEQDNWQGKRHEIISASLASGINGISPIIVFAILTHHKSIPSDGISQVYGCLLDEQIPFPGSESIVWKQMAQEWEDNFQGFVTEWKEVCTYLGWDMTLSKPRNLAEKW